jgi:hypothetical protein
MSKSAVIDRLLESAVIYAVAWSGTQPPPGALVDRLSADEREELRGATAVDFADRLAIPQQMQRKVPAPTRVRPTVCRMSSPDAATARACEDGTSAAPASPALSTDQAIPEEPLR